MLVFGATGENVRNDLPGLPEIFDRARARMTTPTSDQRRVALMNMPTTRSAVADSDRKREVSSADRVMMYGIERWPPDVDNQWLRKMSDARVAAVESGLDSELIKTAASMGIARLAQNADEFQTRMFEKIRILVSQHEIPMSEVMQEMQYRIAKVRSTFDLTEEQVNRAVVVGLARYADDGGSLEFAIGLADRMGIAEERRSFLRLLADL